MMVMFMLVLVFMFMMVMFVLIVVVIIIVVVVTFYLLNPGGRGGHLLEVELLGVDQLLHRDVAVVALYDVGLGLDGTDNAAHLGQLLPGHLGGLVQQDGVAELYLLDDQVLDVLLVDVLAQQVVAALELVAHTQGVDDGDDAVEHQVAVLDILRS